MPIGCLFRRHIPHPARPSRLRVHYLPFRASHHLRHPPQARARESRCRRRPRRTWIPLWPYHCPQARRCIRTNQEGGETPRTLQRSLIYKGIWFCQSRPFRPIPPFRIFQTGLILVIQDKVEMQRDAIREGQTVIIVDDLIATGKPTLLCLSPFPDSCPVPRWVCRSFQ